MNAFRHIVSLIPIYPSIEELVEISQKEKIFTIFEGRAGADLKVEVDKTTNCFNCISRSNKNSYPTFLGERIHVLIYKTYKGEIPKGLVVRHLCDNKKCCNPLHLEIGTNQENMWDKVKLNNSGRSFDLEKMYAIAKDKGPVEETINKYGITRDIYYQIKSRGYSYYKDYEVNYYKMGKEQVQKIYLSEEPLEEIAEKYHISTEKVRQIKNKQLYNRYSKPVWGERENE